MLFVELIEVKLEIRGDGDGDGDGDEIYASPRIEDPITHVRRM